jgi:putative transcriptional regulator
MSQQQLAEKTRTPKSQISEYINNKHVMSIEKAMNISVTIGCRIEDLYEWVWVADD